MCVSRDNSEWENFESSTMMSGTDASQMTKSQTTTTDARPVPGEDMLSSTSYTRSNIKEKPVHGDAISNINVAIR